VLLWRRHQQLVQQQPRDLRLLLSMKIPTVRVPYYLDPMKAKKKLQFLRPGKGFFSDQQAMEYLIGWKSY
jgi:hypothetical protein